MENDIIISPTPGPWTVGILKDGGNWEWKIRGKPVNHPTLGHEICHLNKHLVAVEANSQLIASAPILRAKIEKAITMLRDGPKSTTGVCWADLAFKVITLLEKEEAVDVSCTEPVSDQERSNGE